MENTNEQFDRWLMLQNALSGIYSLLEDVENNQEKEQIHRVIEEISRLEKIYCN